MKLKVKPNSRQIPSSRQILSNARYCDLLYGYLQSISKRDERKNNCRYVLKKDVKFLQIGEMIGMSRQTVSKKFKAMLEGQEDSLPLIKFSPEEKKYYLIDLDRSIATLVEHNTLQVMIATLQERVLSVYIYLLNRYIASGENEFIYTKEQIKKVLGIGYKSDGNNYIINSILIVLRKLGLLDFRYEEDRQKNKTYTYITWMTNEIDGLPEDLRDEKISITYQRLKDKIA